MGRRQIQLTKEERQRIFSDAFRIRSIGLRSLSISALTTTRSGARRTILLRRTLRSALNTIERIFELTNRTQNCWEWRGRMKGAQPVCYGLQSKNVVCVRRLLASYCGVELAPRMRLKMLPGCSACCIRPSHIQQFRRAKGLLDAKKA
jgi:hypothetical protein